VGEGAAHDGEERDGFTASSCIRRDGALPVGSPPHPGASTRAADGEEIVMVAEKKRAPRI